MRRWRRGRRRRSSSFEWRQGWERRCSLGGTLWLRAPVASEGDPPIRLSAINVLIVGIERREVSAEATVQTVSPLTLGLPRVSVKRRAAPFVTSTGIDGDAAAALALGTGAPCALDFPRGIAILAEGFAASHGSCGEPPWCVRFREHTLNTPSTVGQGGVGIGNRFREFPP